MKFYKIQTNDPKSIFLKLGCDKSGAEIMSKKTQTHLLYIENIHVGAANILKQDALSIGADFAVPNGVIIAKDKFVDGILIGTTKHFEQLAKKELAQPFGLKNLAKELLSFTKNKNFKTKIMGVLNANEDSFYKNSRFDSSDALSKIEQMITDGADIIDIGAVSSRPGSIAVDADTELQRISNILDLIYSQKLYDKAIFSIDSYEPKVIKKGLDCGFQIVNDITGLRNPEVAKITASYDASIVIMHMQDTPQTMQNNPKYENVILDINDFFIDKIEVAKDAGIKDIILDVGIGFGKTVEHNLELLRNLAHFNHFGYEILIGASRKSMINTICPSLVEDRLPGTLAIHLDAIKKGASIIRTHDVKEHFQALKILEALN